MRRAFADTVISELDLDSSVVVLLGDIGVANFQSAIQQHPTRVINVGIMEQGMLSIAAGIARAGGYPIVHTIAPFIVERGHEQLKIDFGYNEQPGLITTVGGSIDYSKLGPTHQCPNDLILMSLIPGFNIYFPGSSGETTLAIRKSIKNRELAYIRIGISEHNLSIEPFIGYLKVKSGRRGTLIVTGTMLSIAKNIFPFLDMDVYYVNAFISSISSMDVSTSMPTFILEDVTEGSTAFVLKKLGVKMSPYSISIGIPHEFVPNYGTIDEVVDDLGLSPDKLLAKINSFLKP
jgi:transketolase